MNVLVVMIISFLSMYQGIKATFFKSPIQNNKVVISQPSSFGPVSLPTRATPLTFAEAKSVIDTNLTSILKIMYQYRKRRGHRAYEFPEMLPGYMLKDQEHQGSRLEGAERLLRSIEKQKLKLIEIPQQEEYLIPSSIKESCDFYVPKQLVIATKLNGVFNIPLNYIQVLELIALLKDVQYFDLHGGNLVHMIMPESEGTHVQLTGRIGLIDTELRGFSGCLNISGGLSRLLEDNRFEPGVEEYVKREFSKASRQEKERRFNDALIHRFVN